jgi:SOS-response transcriptional repressor LexA
MFVRMFWKQNGFAPTLLDIMENCHISSLSVVAYNLDRLQEKGVITRVKGMERSIRPMGVCALCGCDRGH